MTDNMMLSLFVANIILTIIDASLGYYAAPDLMKLAPGDGDEPSEVAVSSIRKMLAGVVTLYMFFNCMAYFKHETSLMLIVSTLILLDLGGQIYMKYRPSKNADGNGDDNSQP